MAKSKKPKRAPYRPEEEAYLKKWENSRSAPSLWEKIDRDVSFSSHLKNRVTIDDHGNVLGEHTMSNRKFVGTTRGPRK